MRNIDEYRKEIMTVIYESGNTEIIKNIVKEIQKDRDLFWEKELEDRGFVRTANEISTKLKDK